MTEIAFASATELAGAVRSRELSPVEIAQALLRRIDEVNPTVNAYVHVDHEAVLARARELEAAITRGDSLGPLHGVPYSIKDLTAVAGLPMTWGLVPLKNQVPETSATIVTRLEAAGGLLLGKTNTPEAGYCGVTDNHLFGPTQNPWKLGRIAGGSSGGAAAAVAAGLGPLAEGSDGAGSVRIPASCCGVYALKPSLGRIPITIGANRFGTYVQHGPITRTVEDAALMLAVTEGFDPSDPVSLPISGGDYLQEIRGDIRGWRVAWSPDLGFAEVDPEITAICHDAVRAFEELGCSIKESHPGWDNPEDAMWKGIWLPTYAFAAPLLDRKVWAGKVDEHLMDIAEEGARVTALEISNANLFRGRMWDRFIAWFEDFDLLLCPTLCCEPFENGRIAPARLEGQPLSRQLLGWLLTYPFNMVSSSPVASVPCGFTRNGLPVGLQIVGRPRADAAVLRASASFERARPWTRRRPPL